MEMNFLYKERETKTLVGKYLHRFIYNNITRMAVLAIMVVIGALLSYIPGDTIFVISNWIWMIGAGGLVIHALIFIAFAWIINPIKGLIDKYKK